MNAGNEGEESKTKLQKVAGKITGKVDRDRVVFQEYETKQVDRLFSNLEEADGKIQRKEGSVVGATALVAGTTVGAGILALPAATVSTGVIPSSAVLIAMWVYMVASGLLIAETNINTIVREGKVNLGLLAIAERTIGEIGGRTAGLAYLFIHYALLVAYMAQGGGILKELVEKALGPSVAQIPEVWGPVGFCALFGGLLVLGNEKQVESVNNAFVGVVILSFFGLLALTIPGIEIPRLLNQNWSNAPATIPVMFVALVFHNVVPVITSQLEADVKKIRQAILSGSAIPLGMFLAWNAVILGSIDPPDVASGQVFDPLLVLRSGSSGDIVGQTVSVFSIFAIVTSFVGFVLGLLDFLTDVFQYEERDKAKELPLYGLILLPPLLVACINPSIFFDALDNAGTYGISVLFGIIPAAMAWQQRYGDDEPVATLPIVPDWQRIISSSMYLMTISIACLADHHHHWSPVNKKEE